MRKSLPSMYYVIPKKTKFHNHDADLNLRSLIINATCVPQKINLPDSEQLNESRIYSETINDTLKFSSM